MAPIPSWRVAPSSTSPATWAPMASSAAPGAGGASSGGGSSTATVAWKRLTWTKESPRLRGTAGLSWATTRRADSAAALATSTEVPREQKPWASGGETLSRATSRGRRPERKRSGMSERKTGTKSARPACTASRTLAPTKRARWRKLPASSGAAVGGRAEGVQVHQLHVPQLAGPGDEGRQQGPGHGRPAVDEDALAGAHGRHGGRRGRLEPAPGAVGGRAASSIVSDCVGPRDRHAPGSEPTAAHAARVAALATARHPGASAAAGRRAAIGDGSPDADAPAPRCETGRRC